MLSGLLGVQKADSHALLSHSLSATMRLTIDCESVDTCFLTSDLFKVIWTAGVGLFRREPPRATLPPYVGCDI
jgi:hypothetical protein